MTGDEEEEVGDGPPSEGKLVSSEGFANMAMIVDAGLLSLLSLFL